MKDGKLNLNLQDEIIRETLLTRGGEVVNARVREFYSLPVAGGARRRVEEESDMSGDALIERAIRIHAGGLPGIPGD